MNRTAWALFSLCILLAMPALAQNVAVRPTQPPFVREGQSLMRVGKLAEALELYQRELKTAPDSIPAHNAAGIVLDHLGRLPEARKHFQRAVELAPDARSKAMAERALGMSYAFEGDCRNAARQGQKVFDYFASAGDFFQQGEIANETARVCIDSGDLKAALRWYRMGHEAGLKQADIPADRRHLWDFRWEHAQARIAARKGKKEEAARHVAAAKALLDQDPVMAKPQAIYYPYLVGYVAFYTGDFAAAREQLLKANQNDPFILTLLGETWEKLGEKDKAMECFTKASSATAHNPPTAYARRVARTRVTPR